MLQHRQGRSCCILLLLFLLCLVPSLQQDEGINEVLGCGGREVLLSIDRTIAPFDLISVSNNVSEPPNLDYTAVYNFGYDAFLDSWCTDNNDRNPVVELGFTEPLLITALISGGRIESNSIPGKRSESYVTEFTLEHSLTADPYRWTMYTFNNSNFFRVPHINTAFRLEQPITAKGLRLRIFDWFDALLPNRTQYQFICQGVALYGCRASEARPMMAAAADSNTDSTTGLIVVVILSVVVIALLIVMVTVLIYLLISAKRKLADSIYSHLQRSPQQSLPTHGQQAVTNNAGRNRSETDSTFSKGRSPSLQVEGAVNRLSSDYDYVECSTPQSPGRQQPPDKNNDIIGRSAARPELRLHPITEESGEQSTSNQYEMIDSNRLEILSPNNPQDNEQSDNSMIYNQEYDRVVVHYGAGGKDMDVAKESDEEHQILVRLESNMSYNFVPGAKASRPNKEDA